MTLVINPIWDASVTNAPNASQIEAAVTRDLDAFEALYSNPVTLNLHIGFGEVGGSALSAGALGQSAFMLAGFGYSTVAAAYGSTFGPLPGIDPAGSGTVTISTANAAALGLAPGAVDAAIGFDGAANTFSFGAPAPGRYDFDSVVVHEMTEVMGRYADLGQTASGSNALLDFFRYRAPGVRDFGAPDSAYFSVDGGVTIGAAFNASGVGDLGDWAASAGADAFLAVTPSGVANAFGPTDFAVMEALGWTPAANGVGQAIEADYATYFGRSPTTSELVYWATTAHDAAGVAAMRTTIASAPEGQAHIAAEVTALYDSWFGRDPNAAELAVWNSNVENGTSFAQVQATLIAAPEGQAHTAAEVTTLYDGWFGRDPTAAELSFWSGVIAGGETFTHMKATLIGAPEGQEHTAAEVTTLYDAYFGRAPSSAEVAVWEINVQNGATFTQIVTTLEHDASGVSWAQAQTPTLYQEVFGRAPTSTETNYWDAAFASGAATLNTLVDALLTDGAANVGAQATAGGHSTILSEASVSSLTSAFAMTNAQGLTIPAAAGWDALDTAVLEPRANGVVDLVLTGADFGQAVVVENVHLPFTSGAGQAQVFEFGPAFQAAELFHPLFTA